LTQTKTLPPQRRLEALVVGATVQGGLYRQEGDEVTAELYSSLLPMLEEAETPEELEALLQ
jgi:hypothetical protein